MTTNIQRDQARFMLTADQQMFPYFMDLSKATDNSKAERQAAIQLCAKLIDEEVTRELLPALRTYEVTSSDADLLEVFDGCIDAVYVIMQTMNTLGLPFQEGWNEVHAMNMAKFKDGVQKNKAGKVLKPDGWQPPDLGTILFKHAENANVVTPKALPEGEGA